MNFSIWFLSNNDGLLYLVMKNVYPALIVEFALHLITMPNRKLHTAAFCELLHQVPTFLLLPSNNFQLSLPSFFKLLLDLYEAIAASSIGPKISHGYSYFRSIVLYPSRNSDNE